MIGSRKRMTASPVVSINLYALGGVAAEDARTNGLGNLAMEMLCDTRRMVSMEVVEVNPVIDERNRTADFAVELIMSALGKRIL